MSGFDFTKAYKIENNTVTRSNSKKSPSVGMCTDRTSLQQTWAELKFKDKNPDSKFHIHSHPVVSKCMKSIMKIV
jgi:hypothetical protein